MKRATGIIGAVAGAAALATVLLYKRKDGSRLTDSWMNSARNLGGRIKDYTNEVKDRLFHVHGPHGEPVYVDMYDRQFYEDGKGLRIYMDND